MNYYGTGQPPSPLPSALPDSLVDHDDSSHVNGPTNVQAYQCRQGFPVDGHGNIDNDPTSFSTDDATSTCEGGDGACIVENAFTPSPNWINHAHRSGYDNDMDGGDGNFLFVHDQLNHQSLGSVPFVAQETDADDLTVASLPSTSYTMYNNHGSPESSTMPSDRSADGNKEERRRVRRAKGRATALYARADRWSRRPYRNHVDTIEAATGFEASAVTDFVPAPGWWYSERPSAAVVQGPGISLSGYSNLIEEDTEDLVEYPETQLGGAGDSAEEEVATRY